ncbi:hypothetical protein NUW58_g1489 [Xylaria curta]|uniref:Uncharacterized protein n=1 Tax=Xylaria curta TaxID=42375 RepID=A0ACC1PLS3_9PEZI|nr:hypothetical protein NUW58_g1489 [Xylaria curta]
MAPFAGDPEAVTDMRSKLKEWLVQNTIRADPMVRDALGRSLQKRRVDAPAGARVLPSAMLPGLIRRYELLPCSLLDRDQHHSYKRSEDERRGEIDRGGAAVAGLPRVRGEGGASGKRGGVTAV